jgi:hypothetical protein
VKFIKNFVFFKKIRYNNSSHGEKQSKQFAKLAASQYYFSTLSFPAGPSMGCSVSCSTCTLHDYGVQKSPERCFTPPKRRSGCLKSKQTL